MHECGSAKYSGRRLEDDCSIIDPHTCHILWMEEQPPLLMSEFTEYAASTRLHGQWSHF